MGRVEAVIIEEVVIVILYALNMNIQTIELLCPVRLASSDIFKNFADPFSHRIYKQRPTRRRQSFCLPEWQIR